MLSVWLCLQAASALNMPVRVARGSRLRTRMSGTPEAESREALRAAFDRFDTNGDGSISASELDAATQACGYLLMEDELTDVTERFGSAVGFDDFCRLAERRPSATYADQRICDSIHHAFPGTARTSVAEPAPPKPSGAFLHLFQDLSDAFDAFDADGDGSISCCEIGRVLATLGHSADEGELAAIVQAYDANRNGLIDFDEFCTLVTDQARPDGLDAKTVAMVADAARAVVSERRADGPPALPTLASDA